MFHTNHLFRLFQKDTSSDFKVKLRQASNRCKRVFEAAKLACVNETRVHYFPKNWALGTFGELLIVFSTKVNQLYFLYSTA